jgi:hypothetical protein
VQIEAIYAKIISIPDALIADRLFFIARITHLEVILKLKNECYDKRVKGSILLKKESIEEKWPLSRYGADSCRQDDGSIQLED